MQKQPYYYKDSLYRRAQIAHKKWVRERKAVKRSQRKAQTSAPMKPIQLSISKSWDRYYKTGIGVPVSEAKMDIKIDFGTN